MTKRVVVRVAARGYVDGRYIGEEKEVIEAVDPSGRGKRPRGKSSGKTDGTANDNRGNRVAAGRGGKRGDGRTGARGGVAKDGGGRNPRRTSTGTAGGGRDGNVLPGVGGAKPPRTSREPAGRNRRGGRSGAPRDGAVGGPVGGNPGSANPRAGRVRGSKKTPFRTSSATPTNGQAASGNGQRALISEVAETRRWGDESKSGQFAEALAKEETVKRERLHKVLAQSGHGSRRDMEIMITSGRVMVNGIVATIGTSVSASDAVMVDRQLVKLKFDEALPRVLLYHKPEGEIVTTSDPGNRITVFDNLPRVETGKWMSIGRLDINTSGLLIFTTNGELANRLMHPRYEVEREYAVRVLGELTEEQTQRLLDGVSIMPESVDDDEENETVADARPAKFESIEKRGGEGANQWYHVVIREGRNREVRKMFESVGLTVSRLIRVRFGKIGLPPRLTRGRMVELDASQVRAVLKWVGMEVDGHIGALPTNTQPNRGQRRGSESPAAGGDVTGESRGRADGQGRGRRGRGRDREQVRPVDGAEPDFVAGDGAVREFRASHGSQEGNSVRDTADPAVLGESGHTEPVNAAGEPQHDRGTRGRGRNSRRARGPRGPGDGSQKTGDRGRDHSRSNGIPANAAVNNDDIGNQMRRQTTDTHSEFESPEDSIGNRITPAGGDTRQRPKQGQGQGRRRPGASAGGRSSGQGQPRGGAGGTGTAANTGGRGQENAGGGRKHPRGRRKPSADSENSGNR